MSDSSEGMLMPSTPLAWTLAALFARISLPGAVNKAGSKVPTRQRKPMSCDHERTSARHAPNSVVAPFDTMRIILTR